MVRTSALRPTNSPEIHRANSAVQGTRLEGHGNQSPDQATSLPPIESLTSNPELSNECIFPKINSEYALTFGVEMEMVYAFQENLLRHHLDGDQTTEGIQICKELPWDIRQQLNQTTHNYGGPQRVYMGWGLGWESDSPSAKVTRAPPIDGLLSDTISTYGDEPLQIAFNVSLFTCDPNIHIHDGEGKHLGYSQWHLTNDSSITGVDGLTLLSRLGDRITPETFKDWDSHGIELVSRVLPSGHASFSEISNLLTALLGDKSSPYGAFPTVRCGMHVHVGVPPTAHEPQPRFPLSTIQHLAYILAMYEDHIGTLLPHSRREESPASCLDIQTNTDAFLLDTVIDREWRGLDGNYQWVSMGWNNSKACTRDTLANTRRKIFQIHGNTLNGLINLMGDTKGHLVNFTNLRRKHGTGPCTIEFRQHEGTLYGPGVKWWVVFCIGLVRLANHMAQRAEREGKFFGGEGWLWNEWHDCMSVFDLFSLMEFPEEGVEYFRRKAAYFAGCAPDEQVSGNGEHEW